MFVRWKKRRLPPPAEHFRSYRNREKVGATTLLSAVLVESVRVNGKPRQRIVSYLGSIQECNMQIPMLRRVFWRDVRERLNGVDCSRQEREAIEAKLAETVPEPSEEEIDALFSKLGEMFAKPGKK